MDKRCIMTFDEGNKRRYVNNYEQPIGVATTLGEGIY